jgi:hypothetical protein
LVQSLALHGDTATRVNRCEFAIAMHLIVCRTKRGLAKLPLEFPTYLFPQLSVRSWRPVQRLNVFASPTQSSTNVQAFLHDHVFTASYMMPAATSKLASSSSTAEILQKQVG